jgi:hypothetical protein
MLIAANGKYYTCSSGTGNPRAKQGKAYHKTSPCFNMQYKQWVSWADYFLSGIKVGNGSKERTKEIADKEQERDAISRNIDSAKRANDTGKIDFDEYLERKRELSKSLSKVETELQELYARQGATKSVKTWAEMDIYEKREHLTSCIKSVVVYIDGVEVELRDNVDIEIGGDVFGYKSIGNRLFFPRMLARPLTGHCPRPLTALMPLDGMAKIWVGWQECKRHGQTYSSPAWAEAIDGKYFAAYDAATYGSIKRKATMQANRTK